MGRFAELQDLMQRAILAGDVEVLDTLAPGGREDKAVLLDVYRNAYVLRLVEIIGNDHPVLKVYLGETNFTGLCRTFIKAQPSTNRNARWVSQGLADFAAATKPWADHPEMGEIAWLERALGNAFDSADAPVLTLSALGEIPADGWAQVSFTFHPSLQRARFATNAGDIWTALKDGGEDHPAVAILHEPQAIAVWREGLTSKWRALPVEEAMMLDAAREGVPFGVLCEMVATYAEPDSAAARAAGYLQGWIGAGMLSGWSID
jgi:hypothetical protein